MKVDYSIDSGEYEGQGSRLSVHGVFVDSTAGPVNQQAIQLRLSNDNIQIQLSGQVVSSTNKGFAVLFSALAPEELVSLHRFMGGEVPSLSVENELFDANVGKQVEIQLVNWVPDLDEQRFHEFKPDGSLTPPPPVGDQATRWRSLPTISPTITVFGTTLSDTQQSTTQPASDPAISQPAGPVPSDQATKASPEQPVVEQPKEQQVNPASEQTADDRRQSDRLERSIPVSFENLTGLIKEFTHNISYGGMFVYSTQPQKQNSQIAVTLIHPVHGERLTLDARVVHASQAPTPDPQSGEQRYGLGLEFGLPLEELKKVLADFIGSHQKQEKKTPDQEVVHKAKQILKQGEQSGQALLGVDENASVDEIRQAYFKLVDEFHPDRYFGKVSEPDRKVLEQLFRQATKVYEDLTA